MYVLSFDIVWFCIADAQLELFALKLQAENKTRGICVSKNGKSYCYLHVLLLLFTRAYPLSITFRYTHS